MLDFGQFYEGEAAARLHTRIITSPHYAKSLSATFREFLQRYEQQFGAIEVEEE